MKTDALIKQLSSNAKATRLYGSPGALLAPVFALSVVISFVFLYLFRGGALLPWTEFPPASVLEFGAVLGIALSAAHLAATLAIPGRTIRPALAVLAVSCLALGAVLIERALGDSSGRWSDFPAAMFASVCARDILITAAAAGVPLFLMAGKGAVLRRKLAGFLLVLSSASLGAVLLFLFCERVDAAHLVFCHYAPPAVLSLAGIFAGRVLPEI